MSFFRRLYQFDYMGHKLWWFALSGIIIAVGLVSLAVNGLEFGLEFQEGTRVTVAFETPPPLGELRAAVAEAGYPNAQIQQTANVSGSGVEGFQIQTPMLSAEQQVALRATLDEQFPIESSAGKLVWGVETVSASFGKQVVSSSLKAMGIALLLILAYVTFRFQWKYAVGAIAAEFHDLLIVVGIYSLTGREVTTATIAAVLTIMGYSLYDTVIIFDRIRENEPKLGAHAVRRHGQRVAVGDADPVAEHLVHEPAARPVPVLLRRRDAQGLRLRAPRGHHLGRVLHHLHRESRAHGAQGARAPVQEAQGRGSRRSGLSHPGFISLQPRFMPSRPLVEAVAKSLRLRERLTREPANTPAGTLYIRAGLT